MYKQTKLIERSNAVRELGWKASRRKSKLAVSLIIACATSVYIGLGLTGTAHADDAKFEPVMDRIQTCVACHGENGVSVQPGFPILAGQHLHYVYTQLKDFKSGFRAGPVMAPIASTLEKEEMLLIAEYFSKQSWPEQPLLEPDPAVANAGKTVINAGQCVACHLGGFEGNSRVPRLAGQHYDYLKKTMLDFKTKERGNSPAKGSLLGSFTDEDIDAVSRYLAALKP